MVLDRTIQTIWHSKLRTLEKYITLKPFLQKVLLHHAPHLLSDSDETCIVEFIDVSAEVRGVTRCLKEDQPVSASPSPRLLYNLHLTMILVSGDCNRYSAFYSSFRRHISSFAKYYQPLETFRTKYMS